nr:PREDICTED: peroxidase 55-like [Daucus carota subsp. sativus]
MHEQRKMSSWRGLCFLFWIMLIGQCQAHLKENFYSSTCPNVESIVNQAVSKKLRQPFPTIPATLRLFLHDCFFEGCDASILITSSDRDAERDAEENLSLPGDGFDTVIKAKEAVETKCPGVVSCADILAVAARDVVRMAGGPSFNVELGRRDGLISKASRVPEKIPKPSFNLKQLNSLFSQLNLTQLDMIALSGGHTLGVSHCDQFSNRLHSFSSSAQTDPSLDPDYARQLTAACSNSDESTVIILDPETPQTFDNMYFKNLVAGKGLLSSDQVLFSDPASQPTVRDFANSPDEFNVAFVSGMRKLGRSGVKTGRQGELGKDCTAFNS